MKIVLVRILKCKACGQDYQEGSSSHLAHINADIDKAWDTGHIQALEQDNGKLRDLETDNVRLRESVGKLREALVGLAGADGKEGLDNLEKGIQAFPLSDKYRIATLAAIQALRDTLP